MGTGKFFADDQGENFDDDAKQREKSAGNLPEAAATNFYLKFLEFLQNN